MESKDNLSVSLEDYRGSDIYKGFIDNDIEKGKVPQKKEGEPITITHNKTGKQITGHWRTMSGNRVFVSSDGKMEIAPDHVKENVGGESKQEIKNGSTIIPYGMNRHGEFVVENVFKNKDGETSYTGKFKKTGEKREFILHSKDKVIGSKSKPDSKKEEKKSDPMDNFGLKDAKNISDVESNIGKILNQYSGREMGAIKVRDYLSKIGDLGKEFIQSKGINGMDKLKEYLKPKHTEARSGKGKERQEFKEQEANKKAEAAVSAIEGMALEQSKEMDKKVKEYEEKKSGKDKPITMDTFRELAKKVKTAKEFVEEARKIKNVPGEVADEFQEKYGANGSSVEQAAKNLMDEVNGSKKGTKEGSGKKYEYDDLPSKVQDTINKFMGDEDSFSSKEEVEKLKDKLNSMGWTFDYGLDLSPYDYSKVSKSDKVIKEGDVKTSNNIKWEKVGKSEKKAYDEHMGEFEDYIKDIVDMVDSADPGDASKKRVTSEYNENKTHYDSVHEVYNKVKDKPVDEKLEAYSKIKELDEFEGEQYFKRAKDAWTDIKQKFPEAFPTKDKDQLRMFKSENH